VTPIKYITELAHQLNHAQQDGVLFANFVNMIAAPYGLGAA
jgi:hypothetical protein